MDARSYPVDENAEPNTYKDAAQDVTDDARRRGGEVVRRAGDEAKGFAERLRGEATGALGGGKTQLAAQIGGVAKALRAGGQEFRGDDLSGLATFSDALAEQVEAVQDYLSERSSEALVSDLRDFAREHRALFVGSLLVAGFMAVRFVQSDRTPARAQTGPGRTARVQTTQVQTTVVARGRVGVHRTDGP